MMTKYTETILIDDDYLKALVNAIDEAQTSIDMEMYIYEDDEVGKLVTKALCKAAKRGVKVRLVLDGVGSMNWGGELAEQMKNAHVEVKIYRPLLWKFSHWSETKSSFFKIIYDLLIRINTRNHGKITIIDKKTVLVTSANITNALVDTKKEKKWRETSVKLSDVNTDIIQYSFDRIWSHLPIRYRLKYPLRKVVADPVFILNYSYRLRRRFAKLLLKKIAESKKTIWVGNAYFIPDFYILKKLIAASKRGVDVRILLPSKSDVVVVSLATSTFYSVLHKNGIKIYEYLPTILHEKALILDDFNLIGSSNFDSRSLKHNIEINVNLQTDEAKEVLYKQFLKDFDQSQQIQLVDIQKQSVFKKVISYFILMMKNYL